MTSSTDDQVLAPLPLSLGATFKDLVFRPHRDGLYGHLHALHTLGNGGVISITKGGRNWGVPKAPYEMMDPSGEVQGELTEADIAKALRALEQPPNKSDTR